MEPIQVVIVGSGPAGVATALHLLALDPGWSDRLVVVDRARHPREKLCGGAITAFGEQALADLGLAIEPDHVVAHEMRFRFEGGEFAYRGDPAFRVVCRREFDHWLVRQAERRGIRVLEEHAIEDVEVSGDGVTLRSAAGGLAACAVVAADGSNSLVRRRLEAAGLLPRPAGERMARLLELVTPIPPATPELRDGFGSFDFTPARLGVQGYYWDFPSRVNGAPTMNRGLFDSRARADRKAADLLGVLGRELDRRSVGWSREQLRGAPIRLFRRRGPFSTARVVLAGDAAGVDPFLGEGISFALAYGQVAAAAVHDACARGDFSFRDYRARVLAHPLLRRLPRRAWLARRVYGLRHPVAQRLAWRVFRLLVERSVTSRRPAAEWRGRTELG